MPHAHVHAVPGFWEPARGLRYAVAIVGVGVVLLGGAAAATAAPPDDSQPLPTVAAVTGVSHVDPRMSAADSAIAGHPTVVRCLSAADWAMLAHAIVDAGYPDGGGTYVTSGAWTTFATSRISMSPDLCGLDARFTYKRYYPAGYDRTLLANAVATLAHEIQNATQGHLDNATAECHGIQTVAPLTRLLRSSVRPSTARALAVLAWTQRYPRMPDSYRSPDCYDGGPLDLHPGSPVWP